MRYIRLDVDESLKEMTQHGEDDFPIKIFRRNMNNKEEGPLILHWHDTLQFSIAVSGKFVYNVDGKQYYLNANDSIFINSKILHSANALTNEGGEHICINLHPRLLYGYNNSLISRKYVQPFLIGDSLSALVIDGSEDWHIEARCCLERLVEEYNIKGYAYEIKIQKIALELWLLIISSKHGNIAPDTTLGETESRRIECILEYINLHYSQRLRLSQIAASANISEGECCRFMKRTLGMSPMRYLNQFRIIKSANLLQDTSMSIMEIACAVGFDSSSYYTVCFKRIMNCKPQEYRRRFTASAGQ